MSVDNPLGMSAPVESPKFEVPAGEAPAADVSVDASLEGLDAPVGEKAEPEAKKEAAPAAAKKEEKAIKEEIKSLKKKYALMVDGKQEDFELDLSNDEEVKKHLQKARSSDKKFQEAAEVRKAAMEFIDQLRKNPKRVLADPNIGIDLRKFAEEVLNEEIKELEKSPEQREKEKLIKELEDLRLKDKEREELAQKAEFERMQAEAERTLESDIAAALDIGGMPKTARTVKAMAEMMMIALENGIDLSAKDIAPLVKTTTLSEFKEVVGSLTDDQLEDFLGKEVIGRLRKKNIAKAKAVPSVSAIQPTGQAPKADPAASTAKKQSYRSFFGV